MENYSEFRYVEFLKMMIDLDFIATISFTVDGGT